MRKFPCGPFVAIASALLALVVSAGLGAENRGIPGPIVSPTSLNFGPIAIGTSSGGQTITVQTPPLGAEKGVTPPLSIVAVSFPAAYSRSGGTCPAAGAAPNPCTIDVVYTPTAIGPQTGNVVVTASIVGGPPASANVAVSGTGIAGAALAAPALGGWGLLLLAAGLLMIGLTVRRRGE
jgi:hypothetical protein